MKPLAMAVSFLVFGGVILSPLPATELNSAASNSVASQPLWLRPLQAQIQRGQKTQNELLLLLAKNSGDKRLPPSPKFSVQEIENRAVSTDKLLKMPQNTPGREKLIWKALLEDLLVVKHLLKSPLAVDKRIGLGIANRWMQTPFLQTENSSVSLSIAESFVLPSLLSASSRNSEEISRSQLLQNVSALYFNAKRQDDYILALESLIALGDSSAAESRELGDWARFQLAQALLKKGDSVGAKKLQGQIKTPSLQTK